MKTTLTRDGKHQVKDSSGRVIGTYWEEKGREFYTTCAGHPHQIDACWWDSGITSLAFAVADLSEHWREKHEPFPPYAPGQLWVKKNGEAIRVNYLSTSSFDLALFTLDGGSTMCDLADLSDARQVWSPAVTEQGETHER